MCGIYDQCNEDDICMDCVLEIEDEEEEEEE
jgi:hypothetical protein